MRHGEWEQRERPAPGLVRRLVPAVVVAVVLGAGTTLAIRYATTDHHPSTLPSPTVPAPTDPPYDPVVTTADPGPSAPVPVSPGPGRRAVTVPTTRPVPTPSRPASPSPSSRPEPMYLEPTAGMCRYIDFGPMTKIDTLDPKHDKPEVDDETKPGQPGGSVFYRCAGGVGNVGMRMIGVEVYPTRALAAQRWADEKATEMSVGMDPITGLGDDAYGFYLQTSTIYKVVVVRSNLYILVDLMTPNPVEATFKTATVQTARSILTKLPTAP